VKCQSKRLESETGWAQNWGDGDGDVADSSAASFIRRRIVGDIFDGGGGADLYRIMDFFNLNRNRNDFRFPPPFPAGQDCKWKKK
jgi:hypothetical protein